MELSQRFTDIEYKTPKGVRATLSMSNIDPFWIAIEKYRRPYAEMLPMRTVSGGSNYRYVATPALKEKYDAIAKKVETFCHEYASLDPEYKERVDKVLKLDAISTLAVVEKAKVSDLTLKAIVNKMYRGEDPSLSYIQGYLEALEDQSYRGIRHFDEDFFVKEYEFICQTAELTSFYRMGASNERKIRIQVGTSPEAYSDDIPSLMEEVTEMASSDTLSSVLRALVCLYALYAIKPFAEHNTEMAYLLGKAILRKDGLGEGAAYLPLEKLLLPSEALEDHLSQTMKTGDMTYVIFYSLSILHAEIDAALDKMTEIKKEAIREEFNLATKPSLPVSPTPAPVDAEPAIMKEAEIKEEPVPIVVPSREETGEVERIDTLPSEEGERALNAPKASLSDKEVKETAKYLRESHPALTKGQCLFYASHCTMGRYYAIADYKKTIKCAYETARTSMDKLAAEGFYKKLQIKNKFVYTPIKQGDK